MIPFRILACLTGSFLFSLSSDCICCLFRYLMSLFSLSLQAVRLLMLSGVGCLSLVLCSWCCFLIWFANLGVHHGFRFVFGSLSYLSIVLCRVFCISRILLSVFPFGSSCVSAVVALAMISSFCRSYCRLLFVFSSFWFREEYRIGL